MDTPVQIFDDFTGVLIEDIRPPGEVHQDVIEGFGDLRIEFPEVNEPFLEDKGKVTLVDLVRKGSISLRILQNHVHGVEALSHGMGQKVAQSEKVQAERVLGCMIVIVEVNPHVIARTALYDQVVVSNVSMLQFVE